GRDLSNDIIGLIVNVRVARTVHGDATGQAKPRSLPGTVRITVTEGRSSQRAGKAGRGDFSDDVVRIVRNNNTAIRSYGHTAGGPEAGDFPQPIGAAGPVSATSNRRDHPVGTEAANGVIDVFAHDQATSHLQGDT